uniref:DUF4806 domain-containing protein n=1 Tax=Erpetoichthys calabaricus TaxID=27687 RepID=A0A8C4X393_ERPCA
MYHIVNFSECNEVELVPSNWVSNGVCAWPPYKTGDIHKAIINKEQPKENWKSFKVEVMYTTGFPLYPEKGHGGLLEPIPAGCKAGTNPRQGSSTSQVKVILKTVQDLHEKCCSDSGSDPVLEKDILPLQDLTSMQQLESDLAVGGDFRKKLITLLGIQGGIDVRDTVWRIMRQTFTNSLAKQLNWRGINGKTCFHSLHIKDIVIDAVRRNSVTSRATTQEIEMWIKRWLHLAADRDGGRRARMELNVCTFC